MSVPQYKGTLLLVVCNSLTPQFENTKEHVELQLEKAFTLLKSVLKDALQVTENVLKNIGNIWKVNASYQNEPKSDDNLFEQLPTHMHKMSEKNSKVMHSHLMLRRQALSLKNVVT